MLRLSGLVLTLVVALALGTASPARAAAAVHSSDRSAAVQVQRTHHAPAASRPAATPHARDHAKPYRPHVNYMGHDYCGGWLQGPAWCLTFNKIEAGYIAAVSLATAAAFICAGTALITCGAAVGIAAAIQHYVDRHGVCPKSRPKMRVEYFPFPGAVSCV
jgi:hypothetical protein